MNVIDILLLIPMLWAVYKGFTKGFIVAIATLLALILGIYGALHFSDFTTIFIRKQFNYDSKYMNYISFVVTFAVIVIGVNLAGRLINKVVEAIALGLFNRLLGAVFTLTKTVIILSIIVNFLDNINQRFDFISKDKKEKSLLYQPMNEIAVMVYDLFDFNFATQRNIERQIEVNLEEKIEEAIREKSKQIKDNL